MRERRGFASSGAYTSRATIHRPLPTPLAGQHATPSPGSSAPSFFSEKFSRITRQKSPSSTPVPPGLAREDALSDEESALAFDTMRGHHAQNSSVSSFRRARDGGVRIAGGRPGETTRMRMSAMTDEDGPGVLPPAYESAGV